MTADTTRPASASPALCWLAFFTCVVIWGSTFLVIRIGNSAVAPAWAAAIRLALAAIVLAAIARATGTPLPRGAALRAAALYGFFNFGINFTLLYWGEVSFPSGLTAVLYATIPLTTALITAAIGLERLTMPRLIGALFALGGVAVMMRERIGGDVTLGSFLAVFVAATSAGISVIFFKRGPKQSAIAANAVACVVGLVVCLAASFALREPHRAPPGWAGWLPIVYLTLLGSVVAFVSMSWLVHQWDVTRVAFIGVLVPIVALGLGALVLGERVPPASLLGTLLVLAGVVLAMRGAPSHASAPAPAPETGRSADPAARTAPIRRGDGAP